MHARIVIVLLLCAQPLFAADADDEKRRRDRVIAEVQRRTELRKAALAGSEEVARQMVRDHEAGVFVVSEGALRSMRAVIAAADDRTAKKGREPATSTGHGNLVTLDLPSADMATVASAWRHFFGAVVTVEERAKAKRVVIKFEAVSMEEAQKKFVAGLQKNGIYVFHRANGVVLDTESDKTPSK